MRVSPFLVLLFGILTSYPVQPLNCPENCLSCVDSLKCLNCILGYYQNGKGSCIQCSNSNLQEPCHAGDKEPATVNDNSNSEVNENTSDNDKLVGKGGRGRGKGKGKGKSQGRRKRKIIPGASVQEYYLYSIECKYRFDVSLQVFKEENGENKTIDKIIEVLDIKKQIFETKSITEGSYFLFLLFGDSADELNAYKPKLKATTFDYKVLEFKSDEPIKWEDQENLILLFYLLPSVIIPLVALMVIAALCGCRKIAIKQMQQAKKTKKQEQNCCPETERKTYKHDPQIKQSHPNKMEATDGPHPY